MNSQTIVAITNIVYTIIRAKLPASVLNPSPSTAAPIVRLSKKLPDITKYNGNIDILDV